MKYLSFLMAALLAGSTLAQSAPSDSLFNTDQVVTIELTFSDPDFWNTLTTYYNNDLGETLPADVTITDNTGTHSYPYVAIDLKGNSSYGHPGNKKSFKIDFNDNVPGQKYHGMTKVHLNNCFKDPTFMREKIFFDFCRQQGVLAPRVSYANVTMNGTFWGFYDLVEPVDKNFLDRWVDDNDGNLFKAGDNFGGGPSGGTTAADLAFYGTDQASYYDRYELKTNETENDWSDLLALIDALNNSSDADLAAQFPARWAWEPMLRSLAIDNMFSNLDSYINSARNYYIYHDATTLKWDWIKWDANEAFGSYTGGPGGGSLLQLAPDYAANTRPLLTRIFSGPGLYNQYLAEYCTAFDAFSNAAMDAHIDSIKNLIAPSVAADANKQYTTAQFITNIENDITAGGGPGGGTIYGLKSFIASRRNYLEGVLACSSIGIEETKADEDLVVFPNPTTGPVQLITTSAIRPEDMTLLDMLGRSLPIRSVGNVLDLSSYGCGTYLLRIPVNGIVRSVRITKL